MVFKESGFGLEKVV